MKSIRSKTYLLLGILSIIPLIIISLDNNSNVSEEIEKFQLPKNYIKIFLNLRLIILPKKNKLTLVDIYTKNNLLFLQKAYLFPLDKEQYLSFKVGEKNDFKLEVAIPQSSLKQIVDSKNLKGLKVIPKDLVKDFPVKDYEYEIIL